MENCDANVIVGQAVFDLLRDLVQHFRRIQGRNRMTRYVVDERQMPRLFLFLGE